MTMKKILISALTLVAVGAPLTTCAATVPSVSNIEHIISSDLMKQEAAITVTEPTTSHAEAVKLFNAASWLNMMNIVTTRTEGALVVPLSKTTSEVTYYVWYRETSAQQKAVTVGVKRVLKRIIKPGMDVYAKEFAINNYVVSHVKYDNSLTLATAYDALFKHDAVCNGYAWLTYDMLNAAGIPNRIITGTGFYRNQSGFHAWNEVDLNSKWYMLDTTWNSSISHYNWYNLTSSQLAKSHTWNHAGLPIANTNFMSVLQRSRTKQDQTILKVIQG